MREPQPFNLGPDRFKKKWKRHRRARRAVERGLTHAGLPTGRPNLGPFWGPVNSFLLLLDKLKRRRGL